MKHYIKQRFRESLLNEEPSDVDKIINLLKSGDESNIELAYALGEGQGINVDELVKSIYGILLTKSKGNTIKNKLLNLSNLKGLDLSNNKLTTLTKGITNLKGLDLRNNKLTNLKGIENLTNLKVLYLDNNKLTTLPKGITNLTNLKGLYLSNNKLTSLEGIEKFTNLERLSLHNNPISDEEIERIKKLLPDTKIY